jgi:hypothetical protein
MSFANTKRKIEAEKSNINGDFREARVNPLRSNETTKWIKKHGSLNENYRQDMLDKKDMTDLATIFYRLSNDREELKMGAVVRMFKNIGIHVSKYEIKKVTNT